MNRLVRGCRRSGFSLTELLVGIAVVGVLAGLGLRGGGEHLARQRLEVATRRLDQGIQRGRAEAQKRGEPCALSLSAAGWVPPDGGTLPPCQQTLHALREPMDTAELQMVHNFPAALRFSRDGLVLDGGTVILQSRGTALQRCLVMALPLGITRIGRYQSGRCLPDEAV